MVHLDEFGSRSEKSIAVEVQEVEVGVHFADKRREEVESGVVEGVVGRWVVHPENLWVVFARSLRRRPARLGTRFAEVAEVLGDVRWEIQLAAEQDHQTLRPILVHLVGHQSYSVVAGMQGWGSIADQVETVAEVVHQESPSAWDTEIRVGPTGT